MNTDAHEYVSKSKRSCTVYIITPKAPGILLYSTATSRFFTYRGGVWNALTAIDDGLLYLLLCSYSFIYIKNIIMYLNNCSPDVGWSF